METIVKWLSLNERQTDSVSEHDKEKYGGYGRERTLQDEVVRQ